MTLDANELLNVKAPPCLCGHAKRNHINGSGLCLVKSCHHPFCANYKPNKVNHMDVVSPESYRGSPQSREQSEGGPEYQTHDLKGSGSLRQCANCGRWFHNEADPEAADEVCSVLRNTGPDKNGGRDGN